MRACNSTTCTAVTICGSIYGQDQHFNASDTKPARALVLKTKPMYLFMNMLFQKTVEKRSDVLPPGAAGFQVREEEVDFNHPKDGY